MRIHYLILALVSVILVGCASSKDELFKMGDSSQVELRSFQSRVFDTTDKQKTLKSVISTMQDLGFVISKADAQVGVTQAQNLQIEIQ